MEIFLPATIALAVVEGVKFLGVSKFKEKFPVSGVAYILKFPIALV